MSVFYYIYYGLINFNFFSNICIQVKYQLQSCHVMASQNFCNKACHPSWDIDFQGGQCRLALCYSY